MKRKMTDTYCIIGLGRFGSAVATFLAENGCEVMVIDKNEAKVRSMRKYTDMGFVTDDLSVENLREMGVGNCTTCIICIGEKLDVNMLAALNAITLGVGRVIAKAVTEEHGMLLEKIGVESIFPEREMGIRLLAEETGDTYGRTVIFYPENGDYVIRTVGKPEKVI